MRNNLTFRWHKGTSLSPSITPYVQQYDFKYVHWKMISSIVLEARIIIQQYWQNPSTTGHCMYLWSCEVLFYLNEWVLRYFKKIVSFSWKIGVNIVAPMFCRVIILARLH